MSNTQNSSPLPENLQELLSTLLKLNSENPGSAVIKVGNELLTLNIRKIQEPEQKNQKVICENQIKKDKDIENNTENCYDYNENLKEIENINKDFQNFSNNNCNYEEKEDNNPKINEDHVKNFENNDKNAEDVNENLQIYNKDNDFNINYNENVLKIQNLISNDTFQCSSVSPRSLNKEKSGSQFTADFNTIEIGNLENEWKNNDKNEQNYENNDNFSLSFHQNEELEPQNSLGRLSLLPKAENNDKFIEKNVENQLKLNNNVVEPKEELKSALDFINFFQQKQEKIESTQQENPIKLEKKTQDTPKKHFSTSFLNEMKNIPISDNNKINPYAYINVFSATKSKSPGNEPTTAKLIENIDIKSPDFTKKNSNESENQNKNNFQSPRKSKKLNSNSNSNNMSNINNTNNNGNNSNINGNMININNNNNNLNNKSVTAMQVITKQNIAQNTNIIKKKANNLIRPSGYMKKPVINKEKTMFKTSSSTIKEVNEEIHSNDDLSKKSKEKTSVSKHKTSAQFPEKNLQDEENPEKEKEKDVNNLTNTPTIVNTNITKAIPNFEEKKFVNQIKMEIPELEMEENLRFLMEKADRSDEMGEKMFQAINSLLKYKQQLETKEKSLKEKEKIFVEFEQKSKSSTQWSYDTKSTLNGVDPIKNLLEEFYKESSHEGLLYEPPSEADIHFLFLYSSPLITFFRDKEGKIGKRPIFNEIDINNEVKTLQEILPESKREIKFMKSPASLDKIGVIFDRNPRAIHFCGHGVKNNEENFGLVANEEVGDFLVFEDQFGGADFVSCMTLSKLLNKLKNKLHFAFVASCHSKLVGEVFLNAGALHVICVKREERILDKACQIFTKGFFLQTNNLNNAFYLYILIFKFINYFLL